MELKETAGSANNRGGDGDAVKIFRKIFILVFGIALCFVLAACAGSGSGGQQGDDAEQSASNASSNTTNNDSNATNNSTEDLSDNILLARGCGKCHDISPLGIKGNGTGPDLANAASDVKARFGVTLEEFIEAPQGTMHAVWGPNPLTADEKQQIIDIINSYE